MFWRTAYLRNICKRTATCGYCSTSKQFKSSGSVSHCCFKISARGCVCNLPLTRPNGTPSIDKNNLISYNALTRQCWRKPARLIMSAHVQYNLLALRLYMYSSRRLSLPWIRYPSNLTPVTIMCCAHSLLLFCH